MKNKIYIIILTIILILLGVSIYFIFNKDNNSTTVTNTIKETIDWDKLDSKEITLTKSIKITESGVYTLTGTIEDGLIYIDTDGDIKLILNNVTITNSTGPAIYIENAKNIEISTVEGSINTLTDGSSYSNYDENVKACIFSRDDLILSGSGTLKVTSNYEDAIVSKDNLIVNSGTYIIKANDDGIRGNDSITIEDGIFTIDANGDGIHSDGNITINNGEFTITSKDDAIHADGMIEINNGKLNITASEGIEATYVKINDGDINISASDDGINSGNKSTDYEVTIEINGGNIIIKIGSGDTDAIDSNGNLYINGGTINITGNSPFDYDGKAEYNGGTIIVNGETINQITNQMMGGGMMQGNMPGGMPNDNNMPNNQMRGGRR